MATRTAADGTQKELSYRKRLIEIANAINSAGSIQDILVDIKDKMLDLVDVRARHHLRPRHQEPGAVLAGQGGQRGQGDPRPQDLRLHRGLHRPQPQDREHQERLRPGRAHPPASEPQVRLALGQGRRLPHQPGAGHPDPVREVPAGRPAAHQQAQRRRVLAQGRGGGRGAVQDPGHRLLQPAPRRPQQQALQVRPARGQGPRLREGPRERDRQRAHQPVRRLQGPDRGLQGPQGGDRPRADAVLQHALRRPGRPHDAPRRSRSG